ncbi:Similar to Staphylococcal secretory antigen ssaA; acc. no. Q5HLV2 [Pyronema omphalodes CBS 100304]|uniref:Similar to Staphylococcal secretory antigen ssaA acc. no. Q5HLV2 n=1 Tax=Pyronema omphalodes (strain CBS 100304) TaxID=1076935 RepID=U4LJD9_PYROM|nr:Similar to Staphylococcal secretory antigen ssaA; acc. no. Q5HLV2 [Pyronema omphalodes CBS 100304]
MKFSIITPIFVLAAGLASAAPAPSPAPAPYPLVHTDTLNCRSSPSTSSSITKTYKKSDDIKITCQTYGDTIKGNNIWDKTPDGCYVSDYYVKTGKSGFVVGKCANAPAPKPPAGKVPGPRVDDYDYRGRCSGVDPWLYYKCQCVSFVAQRINERLGIKFNNKYKGATWGYANQWDEAARRSGVLINKTPKPGAIAQTNAGSMGHVAWVSAVNGNKVTVEEYNYVHVKGYGVRTVDKGTFNYIHLTSST